jgi:hypothetical protein
MTLKRTLSVWWAFFWKMFLLWLICGFLVEIVEYNLSVWDVDYDIANYIIWLVEFVYISSTSFLVMRHTLKKKYTGFTIRSVNGEQV